MKRRKSRFFVTDLLMSFDENATMSRKRNCKNQQHSHQAANTMNVTNDVSDTGKANSNDKQQKDRCRPL